MEILQEKRTTIGVKRSTKEMLDRHRAPGQCYDGFLWQMLELWEETCVHKSRRVSRDYPVRS
jgi:hypothetical protein